LVAAVAMLVTAVFAVSVAAKAVVAVMVVVPLGGEAVVAVGGGAMLVLVVFAMSRRWRNRRPIVGVSVAVGSGVGGGFQD
jgi:hypothetical protein